ncbi:winged helix-turn-helix transcriptional regulator [Streptomyces sp. NBC_00989]|uniref:winged helix-turn-helix transcriptional regulator n=1 Tax=Streptomyces sp. NBC_00989 TaxID=2903705 RepID=UPI00386D7BD5|nr:winged helix-turn-helix transcriptional regulator [Streptomyces sp. NBC_00989]
MLIAASADSELPIIALRFISEPIIRPPLSESAAIALRTSLNALCGVSIRGPLERDGIVSRTVFPTTPPAVEYAFTDVGHDLQGVLQPLAARAEDHADTI